MSARLSDRPPADQFARLRRIIAQEQDQGCRDRLVIGGLAGLVANLCQGLAEQAPDRRAQLAQVAGLVADYAALEPDARRIRLTSVLARLQAAEGGTPIAPPGQPAPAAPRLLPGGVPAASPPARRPPARPLAAEQPVTELPMVGEGRARLLARLNVTTIRDLLYHLPIRHEDYTRTPPVSGLMYGQPQTVVGRFTAVDSAPVRGNRVRVVARLVDQTGSIRCTWFFPARMAQHRRLPLDELVVVSGKVGQFNGVLAFEQPDYELADAELLHVGRLVPVYGATEGLYQKQVRSLVRAALAATETTLADPLPAALRTGAGLLALPAALRQAHFPDDEPGRQAGRRRLALDELLVMQIGMRQRRLAWQSMQAPVLSHDGPAAQAVAQFVASLPFTLTTAQRRAQQHVLADLARPYPMSRLVQGDVGSGKTVVAAACMVLAAAHGYQAAIMAPTEILAEQHARTLTRLFESVPAASRPAVVLLKGGLTAKQKREVRDQIAGGAIQIVVGTHAIIQGGVEFQRLGLAVVDEQHRFGVAQRAMLRDKGDSPHLLVMTATPIPRSLALTLHGDLDVSVIDELPPGRQPIETRHLPGPSRARAYDLVQREVASGRQAYVVCPLVEESEAIEARAATAEHERLQRDIFPSLRLGLLHGRMRPGEKEAVMRAFRDAELDILVSTAVIEVGIDVPNATVMLIDGAARFGLSQLHQFRGRVGRGAHQSYCLLLSDDASDRAAERLQVMVETSDGFALAEHDLRLRGPGEFFGTRQSGLPPLRVAGLGDLATIELAQAMAAELLDADPRLERPEHQGLAALVEAFWAAGAGDLS